jgi:hypothetical protein
LPLICYNAGSQDSRIASGSLPSESLATKTFNASDLSASLSKSSGTLSAR